MIARLVTNPDLRPYLILVACIAALTAIDFSGRFLSMATTFSTLQTFATTGLVALGLGLSMLIRNFDISVVGVFSLAGCVAVMTGAAHPWLGITLAVATGLAVGTIQGLIIVRFRIGAVGVTLGGLLICVGLAHVLTENRAVPYDNLDVSLALSASIAKVFSVRSIVVLAIFALAAVFMSFTRPGRDIIAIGSDRQAAEIAGVAVKRLTVATLAFSGFCAALSGSLLSYSLASASPSAEAEVIVPAAAAAIFFGGVSLGGGSGRPLGIVAGALTIAVMRSGLNAIGVASSLNGITMGAILFIVAIVDGRHFVRWLATYRAGNVAKRTRNSPAVLHAAHDILSAQSARAATIIGDVWHRCASSMRRTIQNGEAGLPAARARPTFPFRTCRSAFSAAAKASRAAASPSTITSSTCAKALPPACYSARRRPRHRPPPARRSTADGARQ